MISLSRSVEAASSRARMSSRLRVSITRSGSLGFCIRAPWASPCFASHPRKALMVRA